MKNRNVLYVIVAVLGIALFYVYNEKTGNAGFSGIFNSEPTDTNEGWQNDPGWSNQTPDRPSVNPLPTPPVDENPPTPPEIRPPDRDNDRDNRRPPFRPG